MFVFQVVVENLFRVVNYSKTEMDGCFEGASSLVFISDVLFLPRGLMINFLRAEGPSVKELCPW